MNRTNLDRVTLTGSFASSKCTGPRVAKRLAILASATAAAALTSSAWATQFIYTPTNSTTDLWSAGTDWSAAPVSAASTELTFVSPNTAVITDGLINTSTDNFTGLFQLNILDLQGTGPGTTAAIININSTSPATGLQLLSNGSTTPVVNLNALSGTAALTYNINAPITFTNNTNFTGNGTASFNLLGPLTGAAGTTVQKTGSSTLTINSGSATDTFVTLQGNGGALTIAGGTINTTNMSAAGANAIINQTGGIVTTTTDTRIASSGVQWNISGGTYNLSKLTLGSAAASNINNVMTVSGSAIVNQNQATTAAALWVGGNNSGSGTLILENSASWTDSATSNGATNNFVVGRFGGTGVFTIQDNATLSYSAQNVDVGDCVGGPSSNGTINLNGGTMSVIGFAQGPGNGTANVSTATFNANGGTVKALAANANFFNGFAPATAIKTGSMNLLAGGLNFNSNGFNDTIANAMSGAGGLTKLGAGTLTLSGSSTYNGNTNVSGGTLLVNGTNTTTGSPNLTIAASATLGGIGTVTGALNHTAGTITGATVGTIGTLTLSSPLTLNGGTSDFDVNGANVSIAGNNSTAGDQIQVNNSLTFGATPEIINFAFSNPGSLPSSAFTYKLFGYTGTLSGTPNLTYTSNLGRSLFSTSTATAGEVDAIVTPVADHLTWNSTASSTWDVQTTPNWFNADTNAVDKYFDGDNVTFADNNGNSSPPNAQLQTSIAINSTVNPGSVTVSSNSNNYTFSGTGAISGPGALSMTGTSTLTILTNNTYIGGTTINAGGTIQLGDGTVTTGTLGSGTVTNNGSLITDYGGTGTVVLANAIGGNGTLTQNGTATVSITGTSNYGGNTTINNGTLELDGTGSLTGAGSIVDNTAIVATGTNILGGNLHGAGTVTTTGTAVLKLTGDNSAFAGTTTVNTGTSLQIGNAGTTGTMPGGTLNLAGTLAFNRTDTLTLTAPLTFSTGTVAQIGAGNLVLSGVNTITNLNIGMNATAGTVTVPSGASLAVGSGGTGALNVAVSPNASGAVTSTGTLDVSQASSFTTNVATFSVGTTGNQAITAFGTLKLPANSSLTATTSFLIGDSAGAQNGNTLQPPPLNGSSTVTTGTNGTTTINTPIFAVGRTKSSATFTLGSGETLSVAGIGTGGRTAMSVGNIITGGGSGNYVDTADFSSGVVNLVLSGLIVGDNFNNSGAGAATVNGTMIIGTSALNHIDISGPATGPVGNSGVVVVGRESSNTTGAQTGILTIGNLDNTSSITATDNGTAILVGGAQTAGNSLGTLNLNGGSITFNTSGSAIASDNNAFETFPTQGTATVNFNGMTLVAGADSSTWIENIVLADGLSSGANVMAGGLIINTNGHSVTVPQPFVSGAATDGGLTKLGAGTLTLGGNSSYNGPTTVSNGTLSIASGVTLPSASAVTVGNATTSGLSVALAGAGMIGGTANILGTGPLASAGQVSPGNSTATLGTLTFANGLTFNAGGAADFRLAVGPGSTTSTPGFSSLISVTGGSLTLPTGAGGASPGSIVVNLTDDSNAGGQGSLGSGTYELFSFGSLTNAFDPSEFNIGSSPLAAGSTYAFSEVGGNQIDLTISAVLGPQNLVWSGGTSAWDVTTTPNWNNNSAQFRQGDLATFDNTNTGATSVTINTTVQPGSVTVNGSENYTFSGSAGIANQSSGTTALTQTGTGTLTISTANTYTGATTIGTGSDTPTLTLSSAGKIASSSVIVNAGATANVNGLLTGTPAVTVNGKVVLGANDGTNATAGSILVRKWGALSLGSAGAALNIAPAISTNQRTLLVVSSYSSGGGTVDLSNNDMVVSNAGETGYGTINSAVAAGRGANGQWTGAGITSSTAAAVTIGSSKNTALAVVLNDTHQTPAGTLAGTKIFTTFDGQPVNDGDVLIKYTYYGDALLTGSVTSADYIQLDNGFASQTSATPLKGWFNGDFNYDGAINGDDYTLIDNAFNTQGGVSLAGISAGPAEMIAANTSQVASVPEPATLSMLGIGAVGLLLRRRRKIFSNER